MSKPQTSRRSHLALIAGTVFATLAVQRHLSRLVTPTAIDDRQTLAPNAWQMPLAGWKDILARTFERINEDRILATAAGVVFYGLLAIFPAITALVSSYGLYADPSTIAGNLQSLALMLPDGSFAIVQDQIGRVLGKETTTLGTTFVLGLLIAIWSANAGMKAIFDALNVVYEVKEKRGFLRLNLTSLAFTIAALTAILVMIVGVVAVPLALQRLGLGERVEWIITLGRWPALLLLLLTALGPLYRFGPSCPNPHWEWFSIGALAASVLWLVGSSLLSWYLSNFGNYTATYGSLGAAIGLMTWMWMSAIVVLCGAELNSEVERRTIGSRDLAA
jgi:membrane protein